jgi:hypothetical protein
MSLEKLHGRHLLPNSLTLELWDLSGPVAGERWFVVIEARIRIPVSKENLPPELLNQTGALQAALGQEIVFSQKDERFFIEKDKVPDIISDMEKRFLNLAQAYFGQVQFPGRYIRKKYAEYQARQAEGR